MISALALALSLTAVDPRIPLVELQVAGRDEEALAAVDRELRDHNDTAKRLGLDYLRGDLLERLGRHDETAKAFMEGMRPGSRLALHSRYRVALEEERMGHPEVAAGLIATVVAASDTSPELLQKAVALLARTISRGGDCRLLRSLASTKLPTDERRAIEALRGDCALAAEDGKRAVEIYLSLLRENTDDEPARQAAERLASMTTAPAAPDAAGLLGLTFHQHRDFAAAVHFLDLALGNRSTDLDADRSELLYARARSRFWQEQYLEAAADFGLLAQRAEDPEDRARALYQQARCFELLGQWRQAYETFRETYRSASDGPLADAALLSGLRLKWRTGQDEEALKLYEILASRRSWHETAARAALFLAASDLVRGRKDRAGPWLDQALAADRGTELEVDYWRGRLAELEEDAPRAVRFYLDVARRDLDHPLAQAAGRRLGKPNLAVAARELGLRLATSSRNSDLYGAWILLGDTSTAGRAARERLLQHLSRDRTAAPFLRLKMTPVERWPLWQGSLRQPDDMLVALGAWGEATRTMLRDFPPTDPDLAFTASLLLARAGRIPASARIAEILAKRVPARLPDPLLPVDFQRLLYPLGYRDLLFEEAKRNGIDPFLLAAVVREESRFDPRAISNASARGLTQFVQPTAARIAVASGIPLASADDLYDPRTSLALGAAYLHELLRAFRGSVEMVVAAYNAGAPQANLWRTYCFSRELEEYYTKVSFRETRGYLRKVLGSWARFRRIYAAPRVGEVPVRLGQPLPGNGIRGQTVVPARQTSPPPEEAPPDNRR